MINFEEYKRRYHTEADSARVLDELIDELIKLGLKDYQIWEMLIDKINIGVDEAKISTSFKTHPKLKNLSQGEKLAKRNALLAERRRWTNLPHNFDETNPEECKARVIFLKNQGKSIRAIARELKISATSVHRFLKVNSTSQP